MLVGVSRTGDPERWQDLPHVPRNLERMRAILTDPGLVGLRDEDCTVFLDPDSYLPVLDALRKAAEEADDTVILYYCGHGVARGGELHLTLRSTNDGNLRYNSLAYRTIKEELRDRAASNAIVLLDSCYSGLAHGMGDVETFLDVQIADAGAFLLTSSARDQQSLALPGETFTAFTGELITVLEGGKVNGDAFLTMDAVTDEVIARMTRARLPRPRYSDSGPGQKLAVIRNRAFQGPPSYFPVYLAVDVSDGQHGLPLEAISAALPGVIDAMAQADAGTIRPQISIITYADDAEVLVPMDDAREVGRLPELTGGSRLHLAPLFEILRDRIVEDLGRLRRSGHKVLVPTVFILLSGVPQDPDEWRAELRRLSHRVTGKRFEWQPEIVTFGFANADIQILQEIATRFAFTSSEADPAAQIADIFTSIVDDFRDDDVELADPGASFEEPGGFVPLPSVHQRDKISEHFATLPPLDTDGYLVQNDAVYFEPLPPFSFDDGRGHEATSG